MEIKVTDHFENKEPVVSAIYKKLISECKKFGPVTQSPKKTSIHLDAKSGFVGVYTRRNCLLLHIHTNFDINNSRIDKTEKISTNRFKHIVRISNQDEIDQQIINWLESAYKLKS
jgi:hypothetical protein